MWLEIKPNKMYSLQTQNKENKISHGRQIFLRNIVRGWVDLDSSDPLKPLPTGWENTERKSLYWTPGRIRLNRGLRCLRYAIIYLIFAPIDLKAYWSEPLLPTHKLLKNLILHFCSTALKFDSKIPKSQRLLVYYMGTNSTFYVYLNNNSEKNNLSCWSGHEEVFSPDV